MSKCKIKFLMSYIQKLILTALNLILKFIYKKREQRQALLSKILGYGT